MRHDAKKSPEIKFNETDIDSEIVKIHKIGTNGFDQGIVILRSIDGKNLPISSFSAEKARNMLDFKEMKNLEVSSIYNMLEQICENSGLSLFKVRIYSNGSALRANLYFKGEKELILRNYRASDAVALAAFHDVPIWIRKDLLHQSQELNS